MAESAPVKLRSLPGIKRDGTKFEGEHYIDGQWCRFQRGLPRKMGGFRSVTSSMSEIIYGIHSFSANQTQYMHLGSMAELVQRLIDNDGIQTAFNDRTPAIAPSADNIWQFDAIYDVNEADTVIVAHVAPNMNIASTTDTTPWYGVITAAGVLATTAMDPVSGGVVAVGNYLVTFGNGGFVGWSAPNDVTGTDDSTNVTQQKIIRGLAVRGGGVPAALLWSLDSLLLMTFNDPATVLWDFDTIGETSVLSSRGIIEYDGVYYWAGVDRFLSYNGVIRELPNNMNVNWFYDNLNFEQRQKVFAYKVPRFGEIWWCYPRGDATECTHAVVYNVREGYWYDTELPNQGRSDGLYAKVYFKPFMTGVVEGPSGYVLWQHETGVNQVQGGFSDEPVPSHFETAELSLVAAEQPVNKQLEVGILEPDFVQEGDLTLTVKGRANARSASEDTAPMTITPQVDAGVNKDEQLTRIRQVRRLMSFKFESNTLDGDYQMGQPIAHLKPEGERMTK